MRRILIVFLLLAPVAHAEVLTRTAGDFRVTADTSLAFPGGLVSLTLWSRRPVASLAYGILDGQRCLFYPEGRDWRALVPVSATHPPGTYTLGVDVRTRRRRHLIAVPVTIVGRDYPARTVVLPEFKRSLAIEPAVVRDGRRLLLLLRTESPARQWRGRFRPPVDAEPVFSFGAPTRYLGASPVETLTDALYGEVHRGMDYPVPPGTVVQAPAAGTVLMAAHRPLTGNTVVLDHGQGVISVFFHLGRLEVREGQAIEGRLPLGVSGDSGIAAEPHVHWAVYVHGIPVDPRVMEALPES
jgi:peptidase M23-like protein